MEPSSDFRWALKEGGREGGREGGWEGGREGRREEGGRKREGGWEGENNWRAGPEMVFTFPFPFLLDPLLLAVTKPS